jgi:hypothetical protein
MGEFFVTIWELAKWVALCMSHIATSVLCAHSFIYRVESPAFAPFCTESIHRLYSDCHNLVSGTLEHIPES